MEESIKRTFTGHLAGLLTPERFIWVIAILFGAALTTGYQLFAASVLINANATKNVEQDEQLDEMDDIQRAYAIDINTLGINVENIQEMIRNLGSD